MNDQDPDIQKFKEKLDQVHEWPGIYTFKFIVPENTADEVRGFFPKSDIKIKKSSKGNYLSMTIQAMMQSSDQVLDIYVKTSKIEGIITL